MQSCDWPLFSETLAQLSNLVVSAQQH